MKRVVALYRGKLSDRRGTPIRIFHLIKGIAHNPDIELTVFSWDEAPMSMRNTKMPVEQLARRPKGLLPWPNISADSGVVGTAVSMGRGSGHACIHVRTT